MTMPKKQNTFTFVVPDIHGHLDVLEHAIETIEATKSAGTVVFLGDYVDRGPDSKKLLDRLRQGPENPFAWTWIILMGNHEEMLVECHEDRGTDGVWWRTHGGDATMASFDEAIPRAYVDWISTLATYYVDQHRVYVHAAVSETHELDAQSEYTLRWSRYSKGDNTGWRGKHVVHGHVASTGPELLCNRTNLDTGRYCKGHIYLAMFDDAVAGGPIRHGYVGDNIPEDKPRFDAVTQDDIGDLLESFSQSIDQTYEAMTHEELMAKWRWQYDYHSSVSWNIYKFYDCLGLYSRSCRKWEEIHNGSSCVVERVRDTYLIPKIREFETILRSLMRET